MERVEPTDGAVGPFWAIHEDFVLTDSSGLANFGYAQHRFN
ncbi:MULTISPECIES: hypothetical protein [Sphingobacterium]|nr:MULTISPECIES: hypothetical protein [Sphingobacterium]WKK58343.1 hypothetical protein QYC40_17065 [Sphingobacterium sp. BN32]